MIGAAAPGKAVAGKEKLARRITQRGGAAVTVHSLATQARGRSEDRTGSRCWLQAASIRREYAGAEPEPSFTA